MTPGPWEWWTSNSWRRLRHSNRGVSVNVLMPFALKDGGADIDVTEADMKLIAAAPELLEALKDMLGWADTPSNEASPSWILGACHRAKVAVAKAEGRS